MCSVQDNYIHYEFIFNLNDLLLLSCDNHDKVMNKIKDSYNEIRNKIVHGYVPKADKIRKLEGKYESMDKLLSSI
jgi:hypothetical protein